MTKKLLSTGFKEFAKGDFEYLANQWRMVEKDNGECFFTKHFIATKPTNDESMSYAPAVVNAYSIELMAKEEEKALERLQAYYKTL